MNQNDRRLIRKQAAEEIESGKTLSQVAKKYGRTIKWVRDACMENEVEVPKKGIKRISEIIEESNKGISPKNIAEKIGVSRQYVYSVLNRPF